MVTYYAVAAGGVFSTAGTWSNVATKDASRVSNGLVPSSVIDCVIDDYSGNVSVTGSSATCKTLDFNGGGVHTGLFTINNTLNVVGSVTFNGTMTTAGGAVAARRLSLSATSTLTTGGLDFDFDVSITGTITLTLAGNLSCNGLGINSTTITFAGAYDITCDYLYSVLTTSAYTLNLVAGQTLTINTGITMHTTAGFGTPSPPIKTIKSATASSATYVVYNGADSAVFLNNCVFTDVDASGGSTIYSYQSGALTRTVNIEAFDPPPTPGESSGAAGFIALR